MTTEPDQRPSSQLTPAERWPFYRDVALFIGGMLGAIHETLLTTAERPTLLILFAAMMGLPAFLGTK